MSRRQVFLLALALPVMSMPVSRALVSGDRPQTSIAAPHAEAPPSDDLPNITADVTAGLAIHLPATDGATEIDLAKSGQTLVHGLATTDAQRDRARQAIAARGLYGLATVERARSLRPLPYADNLASLVVADLDALGAAAPNVAEILRVVHPEGIAWLKERGRWRQLHKPRPAEMDDWTHFDYGPDGNAVSHDRLVKPPEQLQWISGIQPMALGGNPAGFIGSLGMRLAKGRAFSDWTEEGKQGKWGFGGWNAFNGVPLWRLESAARFPRRPWLVVAVGPRVYLFRENQGPLVALDASSGEVATTYDEAGRLPENAALAMIRVAAGKLVVANRDLVALDAADGRLVWRYRDPEGGYLMFPTVAAAANKVFALAANIPSDARIEQRWPNAPAAAVVCLEFSTGKVLWRNTEVAGRHVGQLVYSDGNLGLFGAGGIGAGREPFVGNIRVADAKLLWTGTFPLEYNRAGYTMLWRDGVMYYADPWKIFKLDPQTGKETAVFGEGYNGRCMRLTATDDWLIHSFVAYVDKEYRGTIQSAARSACANSVFPANGMLYFTPNTCGCLTMLRGHLALSPEPLRPAVDDAARLETADGTAPQPAPPTAAPPSILADEWAGVSRGVGQETEPVPVGEASLVAVVHQHRIECRQRDGNVRWAFAAGGRVSSPPLVHDGLCLFGSHDGWVYALHVADGRLAWRFLAAPSERKIVAYGQVESSWPVYGVVLHQGLVCASSGLHPELGGGIYVWGLEPRTGRVAWKRVLAKSPAVIEGTSRIAGRIVPQSALNNVLESEGELLSLPAGLKQRFVFDPRLPDAQLRRKLESPPPAKKRK